MTQQRLTMDNKQKLDFILKLERRDKRRKILIGILIVIVVGGLLIYSQFMNLQTL
jgi:hypothetical protein